MPPEAPDPLLGTQAGSFTLVKRLGKGGMGSVYLGEHRFIGSKVAIKLLHADLAGDVSLVQRFAAEAQAVNLAAHENIVSIFDLGTHAMGLPYIVMEYLDGQSLADLMAQGPIDMEVALSVLVQVCSALQAAHAANVIHRDLKPENVYVLQRGGKPFAKLLDFGLAKLKDGRRPYQTLAGAVFGTPGYMSPEQGEGKEADARSDVYAVGILAYEMATGRLPYEGSSIPRILAAQLKGPPPSPRSLRPELPEPWERAILRALASRPEERFQSAAALGEAFRRALDELHAPPPAAPAAPVAARGSRPKTLPAHARHLGGFRVEVATATLTRALEAFDISRGGMFVGTEEAPPALLSPVQLQVERPAGGPLRLTGEVVRHVSPNEARAWNMRPGFGIQFVGLSAEQRQALAELVENRPVAQPERPATPVAEPVPPVLARLLEQYRERLEGSHYDLLGLPPSASFEQIRQTAQVLAEELAPHLSAELPSAAAEQLSTVQQRLEAAARLLGDPLGRLRYDAQRGNFAGVQRCREAGVPQARFDELHHEHLARRPEDASRAQVHLGRARLARKNGLAEAELGELEAALRLTPLDWPTLERHAALRKELGRP